ncbi:hypothetical protein QJS66_00840 [Kocuria rhizophila]|nr:hypothetical protein QJS66_00840 [Kocuria rhizophila]
MALAAEPGDHPECRPLPWTCRPGQVRTARQPLWRRSAVPDAGATARRPARPAQTPVPASAFVGLLDQPAHRYVPATPRSTVALLAKDLEHHRGPAAGPRAAALHPPGQDPGARGLVAGERTSFVAAWSPPAPAAVRSDPGAVTDVVVASSSGGRLRRSRSSTPTPPRRRTSRWGPWPCSRANPGLPGELSMTGADYAPWRPPEAVSGASWEEPVS